MKNTIRHLKDNEGNQCRWGGCLKELIHDYFQDLYTYRGSDIEKCSFKFPKKISVDQNQILL